MTRFRQIDPDEWLTPEHPDYVDIAGLRVDYPELEARAGVRFADYTGDWVPQKVAVLELPSGKRFGLVRDLVPARQAAAGAPPVYTMVYAATDTEDVDADLREVLAALGLGPADVVWRIPPTDLRNQQIGVQIKLAGWYHARVEADGAPSPLSYSIGLLAAGHPDVALLGRAHDEAAAILARAVGRVRAGGRLEPGVTYADLVPGGACTFVQVDVGRHADLFREAMDYYISQGYAVAVVQCVWADERGRYPWDPDCDHQVRNRQPLLGAAP